MKQFDMDKLEIALKYIERIADGKNPVNNKPAEEDSVLNNPNVIRCMYFVKEILADVKENDGMVAGRVSKPSKTPFPFECLSKFEYVDDTSISLLMKRIKGLAVDSNVRGVGTKPVTDWLKREGYLIEVTDKYTGKIHSEPTDLGVDFGLYMQERTSSYGQSYSIVMYSQKAQEFIVTNLENIVNKSM